MQPKVYIVILNWNGWEDTIECLESVYRLDYDNYQVIVCDNDSQDSSIDKIIEWANGKREASWIEGHALETLTRPALKKPVSYIRLNREQAEQINTTTKSEGPLILIDTGDNLGFAGGNNVGFRYALGCDDFEYVWVLNNDTVVDTKALSRMVEHSSSQAEPNTCGCTLMFYDDPTVVQARGGASYNQWTGIASDTFGRYGSLQDKVDHKALESELDYITGASWLVPKSFLHDVGLMEESYFLYYEEIDWCTRGKEKYTLCYAPDAYVYHKEGASIGSQGFNRKSSLFSDFYMFRTKLAVTRRFFPKALFTVYFSTVLQALNRARRGDWAKTLLIFKVMLGKNSYP